MAERQSTPTPTTDDEYSLQALNIHGTFFERRCQNVVHQAKNWEIQETNYPVTYGGENSNLDIWAETGGERTSMRVILPIECKKNNLGFIDWIFFRQPRHRPSNSHIQMIQLRQKANESSIWEAYRELQPLKHDLTIADEARETKGDYLRIKNQLDRTKTSNTAITDAAKQITIATQALMQQEYSVLEEGKKPWGQRMRGEPDDRMRGRVWSSERKETSDEPLSKLSQGDPTLVSAARTGVPAVSSDAT